MKRLIVAGIAAGGLLASGVAAAAEKPGQWYITPMVSAIWVDNDRLVDDDIGAALSIGRAITEDINLEFHAFGYQLEGLDDTDYWGAGADISRVFYRTERVSPYILGGLGWNKKNRNFGPDVDNLYVNFGVGLLTDLTAGGSVALRTELRYRLDQERRQDTGLRSSYNDLMLKVGLQVPFGQPYAEPAPAAAPAAAPPPPPPAPPPPPPPPPPEPVVPEVIRLEGVTFAFDSEQITADERGVLRDAAEILKRNPDVRVEVAGHTDSVGNAAYNQRLSERRARAVVEYLVDAGIARDRLSYRGYGQDEPIADNATDAGRAMNRRVELRRR